MTIKLTIKNEDMDPNRVAIVTAIDPAGDRTRTHILHPQDEATVYIHGLNSVSIEEGV